jgi:hypothetical protein
MHARQDDRGLPFHSVPNDVGKASQHRPAVAAIPFWIRQRAVTNAREQFTKRFPELGSQAFLLSVVPVLYCDNVELRRPTKHDA